MMKAPSALVLLCILGCAHAAPETMGRTPVHRLPLRVAEGVLVSPLSSAVQAQLLRDGLLKALGSHGFCLEHYGEFEALLHLRAEVEASGQTVVTLTVDNGPGSQIDELSEKLMTLPATAEEAEQSLQPLLRDLAQSGALRDLAQTAKLCPEVR
jgi:hypothetical protein